MDNRKQLALSIVNFLKSEKDSGRLGEDGTEGLEVAIQCLETTYGLEDSDTNSPVNLLDVYNAALQTSFTKKSLVTDDDKKKAEELKAEGNNLMKEEQFSQAVESYSNAINYDPNNAVYFCNRAAAYTKLNQNEKAISDCENALSIDPNYSKAYGRMALVYLNNKNYEKAVHCYEKAILLEPSNSSYQNNLDLAREHMKSGQASTPAPTPNNPLAGLDLGSLLSNPAVMNMAQNFMSNPQMQNMFSSMMGGAPPPPSQSVNEGNEAEEGGATAAPQSESAAAGMQMPAGLDFANIMNATQQFAEEMRQTNPGLVEDLRSQFQQGQHPPPGNENKDNCDTDKNL